LESGSLYPLTLVLYTTIMMVAHPLPSSPVICMDLGSSNACGELIKSTAKAHARFSILDLCTRVLYGTLVPIMVRLESISSSPALTEHRNLKGIASALIIVRSALGIAIQDEESFKFSVLRDGSDNGSGWTRIDSVIEFRRRSLESGEPDGNREAESAAGEKTHATEPIASPLALSTLTKPFEFSFKSDSRIAARRERERENSASTSTSVSTSTSTHHPTLSFQASHSLLSSLAASCKAQIHLTVPLLALGHTSSWLAQREKFDSLVKQKEEERARKEEVKRREQEEEEERKVREVSRRMDEEARERVHFRG
ncbi:hypothetical protein V5O48_015518, partial [Marasmius crinis-equi]